MRLIDADEVEKILKHIREKYVNRLPKANQLFWDTIRYIEKKVRSIPTVEAKEVVHGEWKECAWVELDGHGGFINYYKAGMRCSNCHRAFKKELLWTDNFCPHCGADMRKKV